MKVGKSSENQIKYDESKFFKPLADLGIEFEPKSRGKVEEMNRHPERVEIHGEQPRQILSAIKKAFSKENKSKPARTGAGNPELREVLNKITADGGTPKNAVVNEPAAAVGGVPPKAAISLDSLKEKISARGGSASGGKVSKDRAASQEEMDKLRNLISKKTEKDESASSTPIPKKPKVSSVGPQPREVPEDVLRKILE